MNANFTDIWAYLGISSGVATTGLPIAAGGTGATSASAARTALGLGSAATLTAGTALNNVVQLDGSAKLPAVDGSQLTNLPTGTTAPALDANHVYAWDCNDAAGGATLTESVAGTATMTLNGSNWIKGDTSLFRRYSNVLLTNGAANSDNATASITMPTGSFSLEVVFQILATYKATSTSQQGILAVYDTGGHYAFIHASWGAGAPGFYAGTNPGIETHTITTNGVLPWAQIAPGTKHHIMLSVDTTAQTVAMYIDGVIWGIPINSGNVIGFSAGTWTASLANVSNNAPALMRYARFRISNIARGAAYARAQFAAINTN